LYHEAEGRGDRKKRGPGREKGLRMGTGKRGHVEIKEKGFSGKMK